MTWRGRRPLPAALLGCLIALGAGAAPAAAQLGSCDNIGREHPGVYLYADTSYRGKCTRLTVSATSLRVSIVGNNRASSIRMVGQYSATLYIHTGFDGTSSTFWGDDPNFSDDAIRHDRASSIAVTAHPYCSRGTRVVLFERSGCQGRATSIVEDVPNLAAVQVGEDTASSVAIGGDYALTVYSDRDFRGDVATFVAPDASFENNEIRHDRASSARIKRGGCDGTPGVYLYEKAYYQGRCSRFAGNTDPLGIEYVLNNTASSIRVVGGFLATVYESPGYGGASSSFRSDDENFGNNAIGHDRGSSIRVQVAHTACTTSSSEPGVYLYSDSSFRGRCSRFTDDGFNLSLVYLGEDAASSIRVVGGYRARVFADRSMQGTGSEFTADDASFSTDAIGDNRASSVDIIGPAPEEEPVWRVQLRVTTGDEEDAGTDGDVQVSLNPINFSWINYGVIEDYDGSDNEYSRFDGDDFERGDRMTYDLLLTGIRSLNDIDWVTLSLQGNDGWCVSDIELLVNNHPRPIATRSFDTCRWLDDGGYGPVHTPPRSVVEGFDVLRNDAGWPAYRRPRLSDLVVISKAEVISRIHSLVGHSMKGTDGYWGRLFGPASVEIEGRPQVVRVDLDLAGDATGPDPEVDINFDLRLGCAVTGNDVVMTIALENFDVEADFKGLAKPFLFWLENDIEDEIRDAIPNVNQSVALELDRCPQILVQHDGTIVLFP